MNENGSDRFSLGFLEISNYNRCDFDAFLRNKMSDERHKSKAVSALLGNSKVNSNKAVIFVAGPTQTLYQITPTVLVEIRECPRL